MAQVVLDTETFGWAYYTWDSDGEGHISNERWETPTTGANTASYDSYNDDNYFARFMLSQLPTGSITSAFMEITASVPAGKNYGINLWSSSYVELYYSPVYTGEFYGMSSLGNVDYTSNSTKTIDVTSWVLNRISANRPIVFRMRTYTNTNGVILYRPRLIVNYTPPNSAPHAPAPQTPAHTATYNDNAVPAVQWQFNDPDAGNTQGAWAVHILDHNTNAVIRDTGWVSGSATSWSISPALPAGAYRYRIKTRDQSGAEGPWSWEPVFYVNGRPNAPTITSPSGGQWLSTLTPTVSWNFSDPNSGNSQGGYLVELVNSAYNAVLWSSGWVGSSSTSHTLPAGVIAGSGLFYFRVRVRDQNGYENLSNGSGPDPAFGNVYFGIDVTASSADGPDGTSYSNTSVGFRKHLWNVRDNESGVNRVEWWDWHANGGWIHRGSGAHNGSGVYYFDFPYRGEGSYQIDARIYDNVGNMREVFTSYHIIDTVAPSGGVIEGWRYLNTNTGTTRFHTTGWDGTVSGMKTSAGVYWRKNNGAWNGPYTAPQWDNGQPGADYYYDFPLNQGDGTFEVSFHVQDNAGNQSTIGSVYFVDTTAPVLTNGYLEGFPAYGSTNATSGNLRLVWTYNDETPQASYHVAGSNTGWATWTYDSGVISSGANYHDIPFSTLGEGTWHFVVNLRDSAGNTSGFSGEYHLHIDRTAPTASGVSATQYNNNSGGASRMWLYGTSDDRSGYSHVSVHLVRPDNSWYQISNAVHNGNGDWYVDVSWGAGQQEGLWAIDFRVHDHAGNVSGVHRAYCWVESAPPIITSVQGYSFTNLTTGLRRVWAYGVSDSGSGVANVAASYLKPGGGRQMLTAYQSGSDWYVDVPLDSTQGEWDVQFQAVDRCNNLSAVLTSHFFVDSQRANDPNPSAEWQQTTAVITWGAIADPPPSSGYHDTKIWLGEWNGTDWVGGSPNMYNGHVITTSASMVTANIYDLIPGRRYRYTAAHYDNADNQSAYTWREFVTKKVVGEYKLQKAGQLITLPIYDPASGVYGSTGLRIKTGSISGCFELVPTSNSNASPLRVSTSQGIRAVSYVISP